MKESLIILVTLFSLAGVPSVQAQTVPAAYVGAGGCASSNCHGATAVAPPAENRVQGNEYALWSTADKHARAYKVLLEPRGKRMAEILNIKDVVHDKRCGTCHVVGSPEKSIQDGVACEACHGAAEKWLGTHVRPNSHTSSVNAGMIDTKNFEIRAKTCLGCHLGSETQVMNHELIAAGHPDLAFELDTFTVAQPAHHRPATPAMRLRALAVGEAVGLRENIRLFAAHASSKTWPEFSDMECYQCHHDLRADSWRIARGYASRRPGTPQLNLSRLEVVSSLVSAAAPDQRSALDSAVGQLIANPMDGESTSRAAKAVEQVANVLTDRFQKQDVDAAAVLRAILANIQRIADGGVNAAEQATMALDALGAALGRNPDVTAPLYNYLEHPSVYRPSEFVTIFRKAAM
jgi:hypothetical protein